MAGLYDESSSSSENSESYGDVLGKKKGFDMEDDGLYQKMSATGGMYDLSKVNQKMLGNFGNSASSGFGNNVGIGGMGGMFGNLAKTGGFGQRDDLYNIDLSSDKYKKEEENKKVENEPKKKKKREDLWIS